MNILKTYIIFNSEYKNYNKNQLLYQYKKDLNNPEIIKTFEDFYKKYSTFDIHFYKNVNNLHNKNNIEIIQHWLNYGIHNNLIESVSKFYELYKNFDYKFYNSYYKLNLKDEKDIIIHFLNSGRFENNYINEKEIMNNNYISNLDNNNFNIINKKNKYKIKSIAHLFVHFFKCGGGEIFIHNLIKYIDVINYLLLNKKYDNYIPNDLNIKIIYYENHDNLIEILNKNNFDIILDHQYYLFDNLNYFKKNIIHFIHTVNLYSDTLNDNINYTINLYKEYKCCKSWYNIIKITNYLGVNICENYNIIKKKFKEYLENDKFPIKKIAIIGRIDNHKFNLNFLNLLIKYCSINKQYEFNIYGEINKSYYRLFINKIKKINNIKYRGYISYEDIIDVYIENDILIHPSKNEAGGTVLLESMNNGLLPICRNSGGNRETLVNNEYLVNNDEDYFKLLDNIKNKSTEELILANIDNKKKILMKHNNEVNFKKLMNHIKDYKYMNNEKNIPNIVHYIYGLKEQDKEFPFLFYYGILSNVLINQPIKIFFHYKYLPFGYWWNKIKGYLTLNYIDFDNLKFNNIKVDHYAHKSDYIRLLYIYKYGGIYYDIDTLCVKNHEYLLNNELVLGIQEKYKNEIDLIGNAVIMAKKENKFIKNIIDNYPEKFNNDEWTSASLFLPTKLYNDLDQEEKKNIKLLNKYHFYYPNYNENYLLFNEDINIHDDLITYHYCNNFNKLYIENIKNIDYISDKDNLFSKIINKIYKIYLNNLNYYNKDKYIIIKKDIIDYIIIINESDNIEYILKNISNLNNLFYYNIFIFIYSLEKIKREIKKTIKDISFYKNLNIYYIELFKNIIVEKKIDLSYYLIKDLLLNEEINCLVLNQEIFNDNILFLEDINSKLYKLKNTIYLKNLIYIYYIKNIYTFN